VVVSRWGGEAVFCVSEINRAQKIKPAGKRTSREKEDKINLVEYMRTGGENRKGEKHHKRGEQPDMRFFFVKSPKMNPKPGAGDREAASQPQREDEDTKCQLYQVRVSQEDGESALSEQPCSNR